MLLRNSKGRRGEREKEFLLSITGVPRPWDALKRTKEFFIFIWNLQSVSTDFRY
jgi:hypothetical protein